MKYQLLNSQQSIPDDMILTVQVAPKGKFSGVLNSADGTKKRFMQNLDDATFERILNSWKAAGSPELLVDADHASCDGGSTRAYAWASNLRVEANSLVADFKFTDEGAAAVNSREYRFVSPVFDVLENGEIAALSSIALTNRPNLPVSCVLNREATGVKNVEDTKDKPKMEKILNALGLGSDASEDDAVAAIDGLKRKVADGEAAAPSPLREGLAKCKNAAERCAYITAHAAEFAAETR